MAQLAGLSLPTPEIRGWNTDIGNISRVVICQMLSRKDENKEKEDRNGPLKRAFLAGFEPLTSTNLGDSPGAWLVDQTVRTVR